MRLHPAPPTQANQADLFVSLHNCGGSYLLIYPYLQIDLPSSKSSWAWGGLRLEVTDSNGISVPPEAERSEEFRIRLPQPEDMLILPPGFFFGVEVSLRSGRFAYKLSKPGAYHVRAIYTSTARSWFLQRKADGKLGNGQLPFDIQHVFEGTVISETLKIDLD